MRQEPVFSGVNGCKNRLIRFSRMAAKPKAKVEKAEMRYGNAVVNVYPRANGMVALSWREGGAGKRTTRADYEEALEFARKKVRELDGATGRAWVTPAQQDRFALLEKIAGPEEVPALLLQVDQAVKALGDFRKLAAAAQYYHTHGPGSVAGITLHAAAEIVIEEYRGVGSAETMIEMRKELRGFTKHHPEIPLLDVTRELLQGHIRKPGYSKRTINNKIARWTTFFNRCRELEYWPKERVNPTKAIKKTRRDDKVPEIFNPTQGELLLKLAVDRYPQYLTYLLVAGWLSCRPSECLRLKWPAFDFEHRILHLSHQVVGKTNRERWIENIPEPLCELLKYLRDHETHASFIKNQTVCRKNAREDLSVLARENGLTWPKDVLRHSSITYRLQLINNIDLVAEESGNSPAVIRRDYRRPIPPGWGKQWEALSNGILERLKKKACAD